METEIKGGGEYLPTINLDENNYYMLVASRAMRLKPGQWVMHNGQRMRFLYARHDGVLAFSKSKYGQDAVAWSRRLSSALDHYTEAKKECDLRRAKEMIADLPLFARLKTVVGL